MQHDRDLYLIGAREAVLPKRVRHTCDSVLGKWVHGLFPLHVGGIFAFDKYGPVLFGQFQPLFFGGR